jgi:hypothetical protein
MDKRGAGEKNDHIPGELSSSAVDKARLDADGRFPFAPQTALATRIFLNIRDCHKNLSPN